LNYDVAQFLWDEAVAQHQVGSKIAPAHQSGYLHLEAWRETSTLAGSGALTTQDGKKVVACHQGV